MNIDLSFVPNYLFPFFISLLFLAFFIAIYNSYCEELSIFSRVQHQYSLTNESKEEKIINPMNFLSYHDQNIPIIDNIFQNASVTLTIIVSNFEKSYRIDKEMIQEIISLVESISSNINASIQFTYEIIIINDNNDNNDYENILHSEFIRIATYKSSIYAKRKKKNTIDLF